jgi:hypothetical protein
VGVLCPARRLARSDTGATGAGRIRWDYGLTNIVAERYDAGGTRSGEVAKDIQGLP